MLMEKCYQTAAAANDVRSRWWGAEHRQSEHQNAYLASKLEIEKIIQSLALIDPREFQQYDSSMSTALALAIQDMEMAVRDLDEFGWGGNAPEHMQKSIEHFKSFRRGLKGVARFLQSESINKRH
jgi:hypothetical protein